MSGLNNMLPQTAQGWDQAAYMSVVIGGIILFFAFISGALSGGSLMTKIFKFSVVVIMVVCLFSSNLEQIN